MLALWHITFVEKGLQAVLRPKIPDYSAPGENVEINRISLAPTINECIRGLGNENAFNTKERKIFAYKILVEEGDESLYDSNYLYYNDLVKDALLTHEYWYTKIICPQEVLMCEVSSVEKRKYIIIGNNQTKSLKDILFKFNYTETIPSTISAFEIVNYLLDEKNVELVKSNLQHEVVDYTKDDQSYIIYRKIWKSKPQMTHYEKDYYEAEYIENCEIKKITRCNKLFEFEEIYSHKRLLEICSSNEFMMATWKLIDEKYIGDFDCHLYVITDATEIPIGLLYYHLFNDKFHISGFEVASTMRRLGIGTAIIKQFFNEYKVSSNDIFLEPLNKESEKFWKKLGIKCSLY